MLAPLNPLVAPQQSTIALGALPQDANIVAFGHRSGAETHQACPRRFFLNYEYLGTGIAPEPGPLYFAVGTAVHHGLAAILLKQGIDSAVEQALSSLHSASAYAILSDEVKQEQAVLIHGLLYSFFRYAWPGFESNFDILTVETGAVEYLPVGQGGYVAMQSRPDAIVRNRRSGEVAGISWKTIDDPSDLRRSQLVNDLQGFMELHYGERILNALRSAPVGFHEIQAFMSLIERELQNGRIDELTALAQLKAGASELEERARALRDIPSGIDYIQTVFLVKGQRRKLSDAQLNSVNAFGAYGESDEEYGGYDPAGSYRQMSPLCYRYVNADCEAPGDPELYKSGPKKGTPKPQDLNDARYAPESWAYRFYKPDNETQSGLSAKWMVSPIYPENIRAWVDALLHGRVYPSTLNDSRNPNPLEKIIRFEPPLYKDAQRASAHVAQQHRRFAAIAASVQRLNNVIFDESKTIEECLAALDIEFPQHLINCRTPYRCQYHDFCHGTQSVSFAHMPEGYAKRIPHHETERLWRIKE